MADSEFEIVEDFTVVRVVGGTATISVPESPTTGYRWRLVRVPSEVTVLSNDFTLQDDMRPGAAGVRRIRLRVEGCGEWDLELELGRAWETGDALRSITCRLIVAETA